MPYIIVLTFLITPTYAIHLKLFGLPGNWLMAWILFVWLYFAVELVVKHQYQNFANYIKSIDKKILIFTGIFFLAGLVSLFIKGFDIKKLGTFIVLFLQPLSLFFIFGWIFKQSPKTKDWLLTTCYLLLAVAGLYAIIQYFTLWGLPMAWWGNSQEPKRALAFFIHPNFYALFSAPLLAFLLPDLGSAFSVNRKLLLVNCFKVLAWLLGVIGLLLSLSRAGWAGLAAAIAVYFFVAADKKIKKFILAGVMALALVVLAVPNLRWRLILPFRGEQSASSRLILWHSGWEAIKTSPVLGLGLDGFGNNYRQYIPENLLLDTHNYPHNIFLDVWVETGILGLISFIGLVSLYIYRGLRVASTKEMVGIKDKGLQIKDLYFPITLFLIALLIQGQVDNPYFKNDLAMVFWLILSLSI